MKNDFLDYFLFVLKIFVPLYSVKQKLLRTKKMINKQALGNILFGMADILSKVDEAIDYAKNSITITEYLKKNIMQNLLTGRVRVKIEGKNLTYDK